MGSASTDLANHRSKIFGKKKIPEISKEQNLSFLYASSYLHGFYIVLGIVSNLELV